MAQHLINNNRVLLPSKEACEIAGYSRQHIHRLLRDKVVEGVKVGRDWLIYEDSLRAFLALPHKPGPKGPHKKRSQNTSHASSVDAAHKIESHSN